MSYYRGKAQRLMDTLFMEIEHGDEGHRQWLRDELNRFVSVVEEAFKDVAPMKEINGERSKER